MSPINVNEATGVGGAGGGGGLVLRDPPDVFDGATTSAAETARDTYFNDSGNASDLAEFQGSQFLAIVLRVTGQDDAWQTYLPGNEGSAYDASQWVDRTSALQSTTPGPAGADATYSDDNPQAVGGSASPGTEDEAARSDHVHPNDGLATDADLSAHAAVVTGQGHVTADERTKLAGFDLSDITRAFVGASVTGSGANRVLTLTRNSDANPVSLAIPDRVGDGGGGTPGEDVHVEMAGSGFSGATRILTLALSDSTMVQITFALAAAAAAGLMSAAHFSKLEALPAAADVIQRDGSVAFTAPVGGITPTEDAHLATKAYVDANASGRPSEGTHTRYAALKATNGFVAADFTASGTSASSTTSTIAVPAYTDNRYLAFAVPDDQPDLTDIREEGSAFNSFSFFERVAGTITIGGSAHKVWRSTNVLFPDSAQNWVIG